MCNFAVCLTEHCCYHLLGVLCSAKGVSAHAVASVFIAVLQISLKEFRFNHKFKEACHKSVQTLCKQKTTKWVYSHLLLSCLLCVCSFSFSFPFFFFAGSMFLGVCALRNGSLLYVPLGMGHFCMCLQEWVTSVCAFRNGSLLYVPSGMGHLCQWHFHHHVPIIAFERYIYMGSSSVLVLVWGNQRSKLK